MSVRMWGQVAIQATAPGEDPIIVGSLWVDTSGTATLKVCTAVSPYTFSTISGSGGTPDPHAASHQDGGSDEISVAGLSGLLADAQTALAHAASHMSAGADPIRLDELKAPTDITTLDASTSAHGLAPKAVAPASGLLSALGIGNGETAYTNKPLFDTTNPAALGTAAPGTALVAARRDHIHANPALDTLAAPTDITTLNASTTAHGLLKKLDNNASNFMNGQGNWAAPTAGAAGSDKQVQFNDGGTALGGDAGLTYDKTTDTLTLAGPLVISGAAAGQIVFPATQNASSGDNTLDDYEEGSWTPVWKGSGGDTASVYDVQLGRYVKIGKWVFCQGYIDTNSVGTITGNAQVGGLPFTTENTTNLFQHGSCVFFSMNANMVSLMLETNPNAVVATLYKLSAAGTSYTAASSTEVGSTAQCGFIFFYSTTG